MCIFRVLNSFALKKNETKKKGLGEALDQSQNRYCTESIASGIYLLHNAPLENLPRCPKVWDNLRTFRYIEREDDTPVVIILAGQVYTLLITFQKIEWCKNTR